MGQKIRFNVNDGSLYIAKLAPKGKDTSAKNIVEVTVPHDPANRSKCAPGWKHGAVVQVEDEHVPNRVFYAKIPSGNLTSLKPGRTFHYVVRPPVLFAK